MELKLSGNSFRKFQSTSRSCPFFWKILKSRDFLFHMAFLPGTILALVPLVVNFASSKASRWRRDDTTLDENEPVLDCLSSSKTLGLNLRISCGSVGLVCILSREKSSQLTVSLIIIHMKNLLDSDWLRAVQLKCNTSAKSVTPVQKV